MQPMLFETGPKFTNRSTKSVTFQGKLGLPIHRWYRLTPSFSPQLANDIADHFGLSATDLVLDPFSGVGTVPLCMKYRGVPACSVELNPYLHFVGTVKTRTYRDIPTIESCFGKLIAAYRASLEDVPFRSKPATYLEEHAADIPRINFPQRWWSPGNLAQMVCLRRLIARFKAESHLHDLVKMAALSILVSVSNAKHNHVSLTFAKKPLPTVDVAEVLDQQLRNMLSDLKAVSKLPAADVTIYRGNSKELTKVLPNGAEVSAVITSPPYPNRFSYARETRPHLFFFDFIKDARAVGQLETDAIGGTWGRATSVLAREIAPKNEFIGEVAPPLPAAESAPTATSWPTISSNTSTTCTTTLARWPRSVGSGYAWPTSSGTANSTKTRCQATKSSLRSTRILVSNWNVLIGCASVRARRASTKLSFSCAELTC